jgi:hypothetical protein
MGGVGWGRGNWPRSIDKQPPVSDEPAQIIGRISSARKNGCGNQSSHQTTLAAQARGNTTDGLTSALDASLRNTNHCPQQHIGRLTLAQSASLATAERRSHERDEARALADIRHPCRNWLGQCSSPNPSSGGPGRLRVESPPLQDTPTVWVQGEGADNAKLQNMSGQLNLTCCQGQFLANFVHYQARFPLQKDTTPRSANF